MTRKSISIVLPQKGAASNLTAAAAPKSDGHADRWVRQEEKPAAAPAARGGLTITIPPEPDWFDMARIGLFLPQVAIWYWTVNAAKRNARMFLR